MDYVQIRKHEKEGVNIIRRCKIYGWYEARKKKQEKKKEQGKTTKQI